MSHTGAPRRARPVARTACRATASAAALVAALLAAPAAQALSADTVWEAWVAYNEGAGAVTTPGALERDGDTLTVRDVDIVIDADGTDITLSIDEIVFTEQGDDTVDVRMTNVYDMVVTGNGNRAVIEMRHPGLELSVAASDTGLLHSFTSPELTVALKEADLVDGPEDWAMRITGLGASGSYDIPNDPGGPLSTDMRIGAVDVVVAFADGDDALDLSYAITGLGLRFAGAGLDQTERLEMGDMAGALAAGFALAFGFDYDTLRYRFDFSEDGERNAASGTGMNGSTELRFDSTELSFSSTSRNVEITLAGAELPVPELAMSAAQLGYGLRLPVSGSEDAQDVSLLVRLVDAVVPPEVWEMADPAGALQRGPATLVLDLAGQVRLPADLFGMETMFAFMMDMPFQAVEPLALEIRELLLRAAGAELTGNGAFTFDASDLETFEGVPRPAGTLNLRLQGGNTLLDTLVGMGMIPEDQAMGARMLLALFARPGQGPDELLSTLEVREDGGVFANDMRLQ